MRNLKFKMDPPDSKDEPCELLEYMMVQANSWLQRDSKLAHEKYWKIISEYGTSEVPPLLDLAVSVSLMRQAYNR